MKARPDARSPRIAHSTGIVGFSGTKNLLFALNSEGHGL